MGIVAPQEQARGILQGMRKDSPCPCPCPCPHCGADLKLNAVVVDGCAHVCDRCLHELPPGVVPVRAAWETLVVQAVLGGCVLADSPRTVHLAGVAYFPPAQVRMEHLDPTDRVRLSLFGGEARLFDLVVGQWRCRAQPGTGLRPRRWPCTCPDGSGSGPRSSCGHAPRCRDARSSCPPRSAITLGCNNPRGESLRPTTETTLSGSKSRGQQRRVESAVRVRRAAGLPPVARPLSTLRQP
jgi:hypothetical protein